MAQFNWPLTPVTSSPGTLGVSSPKSTLSQSFFNTDLRPQPLGQPTMQVSLEPTTFLLLSALYQEIKLQNTIALAKLQQEGEKRKLEEEKKQEDLEVARQEQAEDERRFKEVGQSLYL